MKRLLALALCALFAMHAGARTLYVDAKRPNNKGNALSAKKAKKTLQAAINIARKGDTIVVYPGTYAPIKTNNKKITIKSIKGQKKTKIVKGAKASESIALAQLGKTTSFVTTAWGIYPSKSGLIGSYWTTSGGYYGVKKVTKSSYPLSAGQATRLTGFLLDGMKRDGERVVGVSGGTVASCTIQRLGAAILHRGTITTGYGDSYETYPYSYTSYTDVRAAHGSKLLDCTVKSNLGPLGSDGGLLAKCTVSRTRITGNKITEYYGKGALASGCTFDNSLLAGNTCKDTAISSSTFLNCTIANNTMSYSAAGMPLAEKSRFDNCILWNNYSKRKGTEWVEVEKNETETGYYDEYDDWCEGDPGTVTGYYDDDNQWVEYKVETRTFTTTDYEERKIDEPKKLHNVDAGNVYKNTDKTNRNPKFANAAKGNYKLKKGSYCINKGKLTKKQKKQAGTKDLAGKKRIRGKAIDRGCYEY